MPRIAVRTQSSALLLGILLGTSSVRSDAQQGYPIAGWPNDIVGQTTPPPGRFVAIGGGQSWSAAIRNDRKLLTWGANWLGLQDPPPGTFTDVAVGIAFGVALRTDGTLAAWGLNNYGQLNVPSGQYVRVEAGDHFGIAQRADGTIVGWGNNGAGQLNFDPGPFLDFDGESANTYAIRMDGTLDAWGGNDFGQLNVPGGVYSKVTGGDRTGLALKASDSSIMMWGAYNMQNATPPTGPFMDVSMTSRSDDFAAVRPDGTVVTWKTNKTPPPYKFVDIEAGDYFFIGLVDEPLENLAPTSLNIVFGFLFSGTMEEIEMRDYKYMVIQNGYPFLITQSPITVEYQTNTMYKTPSSMIHRLGYQVTISGLMFRADLWNYSQNKWEQIIERAASSSGELLTSQLEPFRDPKNYVNSSTGLIQGRMRIKDDTPAFLASWQCKLDYVNWTVHE